MTWRLSFSQTQINYCEFFFSQRTNWKFVNNLCQDKKKRTEVWPWGGRTIIDGLEKGPKPISDVSSWVEFKDFFWQLISTPVRTNNHWREDLSIFLFGCLWSSFYFKTFNHCHALFKGRRCTMQCCHSNYCWHVYFKSFLSHSEIIFFFLSKMIRYANFSCHMIIALLRKFCHNWLHDCTWKQHFLLGGGKRFVVVAIVVFRWHKTRVSECRQLEGFTSESSRKHEIDGIHERNERAHGGDDGDGGDPARGKTTLSLSLFRLWIDQTPDKCPRLSVRHVCSV